MIIYNELVTNTQTPIPGTQDQRQLSFQMQFVLHVLCPLENSP